MVTFGAHGGEIWHCSSGFAIWLNGRSYTTTAAHCDYSDFVDANDGGDPTAPPTDQQYGTAGEKSTDGGALVLGNNGYYWMFTHGYNSANYSTVIGYEDVGIKDLVCDEGGNSGEHCNVKVTALGVNVTGAGSLSLLRGILRLRRVQRDGVLHVNANHRLRNPWRDSLHLSRRLVLLTTGTMGFDQPFSRT